MLLPYIEIYFFLVATCWRSGGFQLQANRYYLSVKPECPGWYNCETGTSHFYACRPGYYMNGSSITTCLESGVWFPPVGNCVPVASSE